MVIILNGHMMIKSERWVSLKVSHEPHIIYNIKKKKTYAPASILKQTQTPFTYYILVKPLCVCVFPPNRCEIQG